MPLFYFDSDDGDALVRDEEGMTLAHAAQARRYALIVLAVMLRDHVEEGGRRMLLVAVRDGEGKVVYRATLTLKGEWAASTVV